jgi:membrane-associated phospholipid phosphatase
MTDPVPHNQNRLGQVIGRIFHPLVIFFPTLMIVLKDADPLAAVGWLVFITIVILVLAAIVLLRLKRQGKHTYQREARHQIYVAFWGSMVVCVGLGVALDAPHRLVFSLLCLCLWVPSQYVINARYTKISVHVAVITGIAFALIVMGDLNTVLLVSGALVAVLATAWARMVTGNHSLMQVALGMAVSVLSVLLACGLFSLWQPL